MIPAAQVRLLMGDHMGTGGLGKIGGKVDPRAQETEDEGGFDAVAEPHIVRRDGFPNLSAYPEDGDASPDSHGSHAQNPKIGEDRQPDLEGIDTGARCGAQGFGIDGIYEPVNGVDAAFDGGGLVEKAIRRDQLGAGDQAEGGFQTAEEQPQGDQRPQRTDQTAGGFFQEQPGDDHSKHHPGGGEAQIQDAQEQVGHGHTSSQESIILRISSISAADRLRRLVKAARNEGRLPEKVSSTKRSDCMA